MKCAAVLLASSEKCYIDPEFRSKKCQYKWKHHSEKCHIYAAIPSKKWYTDLEINVSVRFRSNKRVSDAAKNRRGVVRIAARRKGMKRFLMDALVKWKNKSNRKPLVLKGARQTGKTWLMKEFGRRYFQSVVYINFDMSTRMKKVFDGDFQIDRILLALNAETGVRIEPEKTLIIFDEIQEAPRAIEALKYFCENAPEYPVIAAGSLLGIAIHMGISFPVGKVQILQLYPMSFREFLLAIGEKELEKLIDVRDYETMRLFRDKYQNLLRYYYYVGGMPEAVEDFTLNHDFSSVRDIQNSILELYENDFGKHIEKKELERLRMIWHAIPMQLAKENKKFFFGQIKKGARSSTYEIAIRWLEDCGLIHRVYRVTKPAIPLSAYKELNVFKIYLLDVGLLGAMSGLSSQAIIDGSTVFTEFKGALTEQYVLQQFLSDTEYVPYYFSPSEHNEIDFVVQRATDIVPVEVKAEENLHAKSLKAYCDKYKPALAVRTSMTDYREQDWMVNLPLYAIHNL